MTDAENADVRGLVPIVRQLPDGIEWRLTRDQIFAVTKACGISVHALQERILTAMRVDGFCEAQSSEDLATNEIMLRFYRTKTPADGLWRKPR